MWHCIKCGEDVEDHFELCWNCQANRRGLRPFPKAQEGAPEDERIKSIVNRKHKPKSCLRCGTTLSYCGPRKFHEGPKFGALGDIGELLVGTESLEMYVCPECCHVEFFSFGE